MSSLTQYKQNDHDDDDDDDDNCRTITRIYDTNSLFQCILCRKNFQDPRILCSNGHTFCSNCIEVCVKTYSEPSK